MDEEIQNAIRLFSEGKSVSDIARMLNLPRSTAGRYVALRFQAGYKTVNATSNQPIQARGMTNSFSDLPILFSILIAPLIIALLILWFAGGKRGFSRLLKS